jgi:hypothetical protein
MKCSCRQIFFIRAVFAHIRAVLGNKRVTAWPDLHDRGGTKNKLFRKILNNASGVVIL